MIVSLSNSTGNGTIVIVACLILSAAGAPEYSSCRCRDALKGIKILDACEAKCFASLAGRPSHLETTLAQSKTDLKAALV